MALLRHTYLDELFYLETGGLFILSLSMSAVQDAEQPASPHYLLISMRLLYAMSSRRHAYGDDKVGEMSI